MHQLDGDVIVKSARGLLRGRASDGIAIFKGIPYGCAVSGRRRWLRSTPVAPWKDILDVLDYGPRAIQPESHQMKVTSREMENLMAAGGPIDENWRAQNEECLTVNVWAPNPNVGGKRPVLFWCHGGKYFGETPPVWWFDGESLARREDVVVVTVRHRVGVLGFLHLGDLPGGKDYELSANPGMLDLVDALTWVRENIAGFGGDPENVTIFGESGGGLKVSVLLSMAAAQGLFHKAIIQSGAQLDAHSRAQGAAATLALMGELGLRPDQFEELLDVSADRLVEAQINLAPSLVTRPALARHEFEPVLDGIILPEGCLAPGEGAMGGNVPLLIGTCATEATFFLSAMPDFGELSNEKVRGILAGMLGDRAKGVIDVYLGNRLDCTPTQLLVAVFGDFIFRRKAIQMAESRAVHATALSYMYVLAFETDVHDGKYRTPHIFDLPLVFAHPEHPILGSNPSRVAISRQMSASWAAFARSGNPENALLPAWPAYDEATRSTMFFDVPARVEHDPRSEERIIW